MSYVNAPIHDLLIRIKNAYLARKRIIEDIPYSRFKESVLQLLQRYHFIVGFSVRSQGAKKFITIELKPVSAGGDEIPVIKFYSRPSRRWYIGYKDIKPVAGGKGIGILSTNAGLLPTHIAKKRKIGGELIAEIY